MTNDCYRCGWCGNPTDENGLVLSYDKLDELDKKGVAWDSAIPVNGECCPHGNHDEINRRMMESERCKH